MAGTIKTNAVQLGDSATATQNFTLRTNVDGTATLARGNVGVTTQDILTVDSNGLVALPFGQLKFPATANPSADVNTLDDYEEGTWTPTVTSQTGSITTLGAVSGSYTKIGRCVFLTFSVVITTAGTGAGALQLTGIPFSVVTVGGGSGRDNIISGKMQAVWFPNLTTVGIANYDGTTAIQNGASIQGSIAYFV